MCRMYGVISDESWNPRWEALKERQGERFEARPQCNLVQINDTRYPHTKVTKEDEHKWFKHIVKCEHRIGVSPTLVQLHDQPGGPYRTFHDHLLIELFDPSFLQNLTNYRLTNPSEEDIEATVTHLWSALEESKVV